MWNDRRTDMTKPIISFHNSVNAPEMAENRMFGKETRKTELYGRNW
jgi:hypothetical protein